MRPPYHAYPFAALLAAAGLLTPASAHDGNQIVLGNGDGPDKTHLIDPHSRSRRGLRGKFLHITDFHPDQYYKPSTSVAESCHRGKGDSGVYGTEVTRCDSSYALVDATLDWVAANLKDEVDFVVWTGDSARHDNDESIPRTAAEVLRDNQYIVGRIKDVFADDHRPGQLAAPIVPNIGNNDFLPHNILLPGPNRWLRYYADMWRTFIPEEQRHTFQFGGWYLVEVVPDQLAVFSLNTMYFFTRNAGIDDCTTPSEPGYQQMEWLRIQLQRLRDRGVKAILAGHVPPVKTAGKEMWDETCWQKYNLWLRQFRDVIVGSVYGHMNMDHFYLHDTDEIDIRGLGGTDRNDHGLEDYYGYFEPYELEAEGEDDEDDDDDDDDEGMEVEGPSIMSNGKGRYLRDLRRMWSKLPSVSPLCTGSPKSLAVSDLPGDVEMDKSVKDKDKEKKNKGKKGKKGSNKLGGKWAERYHLSLVSPSIVPNFFPSLRVIEYNITGLEDAPTWAPAADTNSPAALDLTEMGELEYEIRQAKAVARAKNGKKGKKKKGRKGKKKKKKKDPNLVVPDPPAKNSPPGPAYAPQPLTWTGYTQYFANITQMNDVAADGEEMPLEEREGDSPPKKEFGYAVEYDTFSDKVLKLADLTVKNYVRLAYRIGMGASKKESQGRKRKGKEKAAFENIQDERDEEGDGYEEADEDEEGEHGEDEDGEEEDGGEGENGVGAEAIECQVPKPGKDKKRRRESKKAWRRFVSYAFVSTGYEQGAVKGFGEVDNWDE